MMEVNNPRMVWKACILVLICLLFIKFHFVDLMVTQGRSMLPTIKPGSLLLVNRAAYGFRVSGAGFYLFRWSKPRPGDLLVFYTPLGERAVKRCHSVNEEGAFFVRGDNDLESFDSRSYGFVPLDHILGKVVGIR